MVGLRTQETEKFKNYFALVQEEAQSQSCVFFLDCGEGREFETEQLCGEDLSGWLIPLEQAYEFDTQFKSNTITELWSKYICFATWSKVEGRICVNFQNY